MPQKFFSTNFEKENYFLYIIFNGDFEFSYIKLPSAYPTLELNIEGNRKRGRPAKAKSALQLQINQEESEELEEEN